MQLILTNGHGIVCSSPLKTYLAVTGNMWEGCSKFAALPFPGPHFCKFNTILKVAKALLKA